MMRLRAAIRLESPDVPAWAASAIRKVAPYADLALTVVVEPPRPPTLLDAYLRLDRRFLRIGVDPLAPDDSPAAEVRTCSGAEAVAAISGLNVDLVLDFCTNPRSVLPGLGSLGTWYVRLGTPDVRDVATRSRRRQDVFDLDLVARRSDGHELVLERSVTAVDAISPARTVDPALWKATAMLERCLRRAVEARDLDGALSIAVADDAQRHGVAGLTIAIIATLARIARRRIGKTFWKDEWFLAARPVNTHRPGRFRRLPQAENGYRADPFLFEHAGRSYVFFEEFDYGRGLGHLSVGVLDATGELGEIVPCLVPDFHVSYPGVFEHDGKIYMLPETVSRKTITLYEAVEFPTSWRIARELVGGVRAVDPTLHFDGERWWLFACVYERGAAVGDELFLWSAESLAADWTSHPANPVVSDVRCARPAGMLFRRGNDLIRPAQDGSRGYGSGMILRRITTMTRDAYAEETVGVIDATWLSNARRTHTFNSSDTFEVTDGEARRFRYLRRSRGSV